MFSLVSNPCVVVLLFLIPVMAYLVYLCAVYRAEIHNLLVDVENGKTEIRSLKGYIAKSKELRKPYTYVSATDHIENVIYWREVNQQLRLTLVDGSIYVVLTPAEYKLNIQDQTEENKSENL